ncbi:SMI1/KNR4 family protein [Streptomyces xanthochromogenes]|uniref:SMI1/KNR4 family protein n=1 Tax=Streptomyces xanthochromogenes TaxID=67384 RepID=UPI00381B2E35
MTSRAMEAVEKLITLVHANEDEANHLGACDSRLIEAAEHAMGLTFPPSYRRFVEEFGSLDIAAEDFLGVYKTPAGGDTLWGSSRETLDARDSGMPLELIAVQQDGMGGIYVLDSSSPDSDGEYPVMIWEPWRTSMEFQGNSFGEFALSAVLRALEESLD